MRLLLLTQDRRLLTIDAATGKANRYLDLPQTVRLPPVVDAAHGLIYLVAQQSNIYVLAYDPGSGVKGDSPIFADTKIETVPACRQVLHLGHEAGTIAAAPCVSGDFLFVPVNDSPDQATVRVLSIATARKDEPLASVQRINNVRGFIDASPAALGGGAIVVTAQGGMVAIQPNEAGDKPFRVTARVEPALDERSAHFVISDSRTFWVTGPQLTRYAVQSAEGQFATQSAIDLGTDFTGPPSIEEGTIFAVTRRPGLPGATVSARRAGEERASVADLARRAAGGCSFDRFRFRQAHGSDGQRGHVSPCSCRTAGRGQTGRAGALRPVRAAQQARQLGRVASRGTLCHQRRRRNDLGSRLRSAGARPLLPLAGDAA